MSGLASTPDTTDTITLRPPRPLTPRRIVRSLTDLAADDFAEQLPTLALKFPELKLLNRSEVNGTRLNRDAG
jgi:hypothetical protein